MCRKCVCVCEKVPCRIPSQYHSCFFWKFWDPQKGLNLGPVQNTKMILFDLSNYNARWNALQHAAAHGNTLQHNATHCNTLQHTATRYNALQHTRSPVRSLSRAHCNTWQHATTHCNTLQRTATHQKSSEKSQQKWPLAACGL